MTEQAQRPARLQELQRALEDLAQTLNKAADDVIHDADAADGWLDEHDDLFGMVRQLLGRADDLPAALTAFAQEVRDLVERVEKAIDAAVEE